MLNEPSMTKFVEVSIVTRLHSAVSTFEYFQNCAHAIPWKIQFQEWPVNSSDYFGWKISYYFFVISGPNLGLKMGPIL